MTTSAAFGAHPPATPLTQEDDPSRPVALRPRLTAGLPLRAASKAPGRHARKMSQCADVLLQPKMVR
jgi:hypothetical protein